MDRTYPPFLSIVTVAGSATNHRTSCYRLSIGDRSCQDHGKRADADGQKGNCWLAMLYAIRGCVHRQLVSRARLNRSTRRGSGVSCLGGLPAPTREGNATGRTLSWRSV